MILLLSGGLIIISTFIYVSRPLSLGALIIILSLVLTCLLGITVRPWWGFILFLIYVGALLVLFVYVIAVSPNCFFSRPEKIRTFSYALIGLMRILFLVILLLPEVQFSVFDKGFLVVQKPILLDSYFNITSLVSLRLVLLFAIVCVVNLIPGKRQGAPLRPFSGFYISITSILVFQTRGPLIGYKNGIPHSLSFSRV